jgi:UDP-galactopyranose mutase
MKEYDFLIVGAGLYGSVCAHELNKKGYKCIVLEKRNHIGGNCYTESRDNINIHLYGAHIFHTSNQEVWKWINQFASFNDYKHKVVANYDGKIYSLPFNMYTFSELWDISRPEEAKKIISQQCLNIENPKNLEEQSLKMVGRDLYEKLIKGYTEKQWKKDAKDLPKEIIKRLPVRFSYNNNYFSDTYQGIPLAGYTEIFEKILTGIEVKINEDYLNNRKYWDNLAKKIIYTGPIDLFFDYTFGELEYKTTKFEHKRLDTDNYQGISVMNFTKKDIDYTRTIEHKHFENSDSKVSWVTWEYPEIYNKTKEPFYPVNDVVNNNIHSKYLKLSESFENTYFGGRLAEYKYYDMDKVIESALLFTKKF